MAGSSEMRQLVAAVERTSGGISSAVLARRPSAGLEMSAYYLCGACSDTIIAIVLPQLPPVLAIFPSSFAWDVLVLVRSCLAKHTEVVPAE